jgi:hypothetical protein
MPDLLGQPSGLTGLGLTGRAVPGMTGLRRDPGIVQCKPQASMAR